MSGNDSTQVIPIFVCSLGTLVLAAAVAVMIKWFFSHKTKMEQQSEDEGNLQKQLDPKTRDEERQRDCPSFLYSVAAKDEVLLKVSDGVEKVNSTSLSKNLGTMNKIPLQDEYQMLVDCAVCSFTKTEICTHQKSIKMQMCSSASEPPAVTHKCNKEEAGLACQYVSPTSSINGNISVCSSYGDTHINDNTKQELQGYTIHGRYGKSVSVRKRCWKPQCILDSTTPRDREDSTSEISVFPGDKIQNRLIGLGTSCTLNVIRHHFLTMASQSHADMMIWRLEKNENGLLSVYDFTQGIEENISTANKVTVLLSGYNEQYVINRQHKSRQHSLDLKKDVSKPLIFLPKFKWEIITDECIPACMTMSCTNSLNIAKAKSIHFVKQLIDSEHCLVYLPCTSIKPIGDGNEKYGFSHHEKNQQNLPGRPSCTIENTLKQHASLQSKITSIGLYTKPQNEKTANKPLVLENLKLDDIASEYIEINHMLENEFNSQESTRSRSHLECDARKSMVDHYINNHRNNYNCTTGGIESKLVSSAQNLGRDILKYVTKTEFAVRPKCRKCFNGKVNSKEKCLGVKHLAGQLQNINVKGTLNITVNKCLRVIKENPVAFEGLHTQYKLTDKNVSQGKRSSISKFSLGFQDKPFKIKILKHKEAIQNLHKEIDEVDSFTDPILTKELCQQSQLETNSTEKNNEILPTRREDDGDNTILKISEHNLSLCSILKTELLNQQSTFSNKTHTICTGSPLNSDAVSSLMTPVDDTLQNSELSQTVVDKIMPKERTTLQDNSQNIHKNLTYNSTLKHEENVHNLSEFSQKVSSKIPDDQGRKNILSNIAENSKLRSEPRCPLIPDTGISLVTKSCENLYSHLSKQRSMLKSKAQSMVCLLAEYYSSGDHSSESGPIEELSRGSFIRIPKAMRFQLTLGNCIELLTFARKNCVPDLIKAVYSVISDNYLHVLKNPAIYGRLSGLERDQILQLRMRGKASLCIIEMKSIFHWNKNRQNSAEPNQSHSKGQFYTLDMEKNQWKIVTSIPDEACLQGSSICSMHNYLFIAGGIQKLGENSVCSNKLFCYNPLTDIWSQLTPMNQARSQLKLIPVDGHLYAIGGECLHTVEKYDPRLNKWTFTAPLPKGSFAVAHEAVACGGNIFVSGGHLFYRLLKYSPANDQWEECPFNESRGRSCDMVAVGNIIYRFDIQKDSRISIFTYNTIAKIWSENTAVFPGSKIPFRCVVIDGLIFCLNRESTKCYTVNNGEIIFKSAVFPNFPSRGIGSACPVVLNLPGKLSQTSV